MWIVTDTQHNPIKWSVGFRITTVRADNLADAITAYESVSDGTPMLITNGNGTNFRMNVRSDIESLAARVAANEEALEMLRTIWRKATA